MVSRVQVLLAAVCFGTTGTAQVLGPAASPATVGASRIVVGAFLLVLVAAVGLRGREWRRPALGPVALGGLAVAIYQVSFFAAVADTGVAVGTVVALGSAPALAGGAAWLVDGDRPGAGWAMATALAAAGVACLALAGGGQAEISLAGVSLALVAGAGYAAMTLTSKRLLRSGTRPEEAMALTFGTGALLLAPVLALGDVAWLASGDGLALALFLGAVPTAAAYVLFARGLRRLSAAETATLTLAEPVTAATLGALVLAERPGPLAVGGIALVLAGLVVLGAAGGRAGEAGAEPLGRPIAGEPAAA
jgi:drug/metabolite transporter, DME family